MRKAKDEGLRGEIPMMILKGDVAAVGQCNSGPAPRPDKGARSSTPTSSPICRTTLNYQQKSDDGACPPHIGRAAPLRILPPALLLVKRLYDARQLKNDNDFSVCGGPTRRTLVIYPHA